MVIFERGKVLTSFYLAILIDHVIICMNNIILMDMISVNSVWSMNIDQLNDQHVNYDVITVTQIIC